MKAAIDTCSLISLVRYYLPFDVNGALYDYIKDKVKCKDFVILDSVVEECKYTAKGIVIKSLDYLQEKGCYVRTDNLIPPKKFYNLLENNFINLTQRRLLSDLEYEVEKNRFMKSADAKLIMYCMENSFDDIVIVSEETESPNDQKYFKKLPAISNIIGYGLKNLPTLLKECSDIKVEFYRC